MPPFKKGCIPWNKDKKGEYKLFPNGRIFSEEWKKHLSEAQVGKKHSEETKKKIRKNSYWRGRKRPPFTDEHRRKISEANKGKKRSLETRQKMGKINCGKNHYRWIKDRTKLKKQNRRNDPAYHEWRKLVWERDGYKCKINNEYCKGRIEAHHILSWRDYPELRYDINNGITLCCFHHPRKRVEEENAVPQFKKLLKQIKT